FDDEVRRGWPLQLHCTTPDVLALPLQTLSWLEKQYCFPRDATAIELICHLRNLIKRRFEFDLRMKLPRPHHRHEARQSLRGRPRWTLVEQNEAVEAGSAGPHEGGRVERYL